MNRLRLPKPERFLGYAVTLTLVVIILIPIQVLLMGALKGSNIASVPWSDFFTLGNALFLMDCAKVALGLYGGKILFSFYIALLSVILNLLFCVPGSYIFVHHPFRGSKRLEEMALLPISVPGIVLSIALIQTYSVLRGHWLMILMAHLLYTIPFMLSVITNTLRTEDMRRLLLAAQTLGASAFQRFYRVVLPSLRQAMIVGSLLVFSISCGEYNVSLFLNSANCQTFPAAVFESHASESVRIISIAILIFLLSAVLILILLRSSEDWNGGEREF